MLPYVVDSFNGKNGTETYLWWCKLVNYSGDAGYTLLVLALCLGSIDRYHATSRNARLRQRSSMKVATISVTIITLISLLLAIPDLLYWYIDNSFGYPICIYDSTFYLIYSFQIYERHSSHKDYKFSVKQLDPGLNGTETYLWWCKLVNYSGDAGYTLLVLALCLGSIDRYHATSRNARLRQRSSMKVATISVTIITLISLLLAIPDLLYWYIDNSFGYPICIYDSTFYLIYSSYFLGVFLNMFASLLQPIIN
ncbi:unnamed protein product [Adineta steineri]|uniref:G-protein coupled receptors family 1 profile domain-containing protein n=1 Tax=Adineta steineri TaxID=433720 RepID=A0A814U814_9BILA|nr:unnamed protein product [Adineta steineri]